MWRSSGLGIGRRLSNIEDVIVTVPKGKACISACAFAAMGAGHLRVDGKLMLHRPFIPGIPSMVTLEESLAHMGKGYLLTAYYLEDMGYSRNIMNNLMEYTSPCKFMVYENLEVRDPGDLLGWHSDDSNCRMMEMMRRMQR